MRFLVILVLFLVSPLAYGQQDSILTAVLWEETTTGDRQGYILRLNQYGSFEEDAGENYRRKSRYLMGQWTIDTQRTHLTLAVDYFMGQRLVHTRYRRGQDFYLDYTIVKRTAAELVLKDELTGKERTFVARAKADALDAAERRAQKIKFGKEKGKLKLPGGFQ